MNERIKELAEHCDFYIGNEHYDKSREDQQSLFIEKFAELLVKECVQLFANNGYDESVDMLIEHWDIDPRKFQD